MEWQASDQRLNQKKDGQEVAEIQLAKEWMVQQTLVPEVPLPSVGQL